MFRRPELMIFTKPACGRWPARSRGSHAALPVAERSGGPSPAALRLASSSACFQVMRSATTCSSRRAGGMWSGSPEVTGSRRSGLGRWPECRSFPSAMPCGRPGSRRGSCPTICGRPGHADRRSQDARGGALCPCRSRAAFPRGGSWAGRRSAASSRSLASMARTGARRRAGQREHVVRCCWPDGLITDLSQRRQVPAADPGEAGPRTGGCHLLTLRHKVLGLRP